MDELFSAMKYVSDYVEGMSVAVHRFVDFAPILIRQHIQAQARQQLNSSYETYMSGLTTELRDGHILVVEIDKDNWLANAVEDGANAFDMHKMLQTSSKVRISKKGYKFLILPIGKEKGGKGNDTDKSQALQKKINEVLLKPKLGLSKLKSKVGGGVYETQQIINDDPDLQGFYRSRVFNSVAEYYQGKRKPKWSHILFRVISENPANADKFQHPGIAPHNFLKEADTWFDNTAPGILDSIIQEELKARKIT